MAFLMPFLSKNGILALAAVGFTVFIYMAGGSHERRKIDSEVAAVNVPIAEQRGKDEAETKAGAEKAAATDANVSASLTQSCVLTEETARKLLAVK